MKSLYFCIYLAVITFLFSCSTDTNEKNPNKIPDKNTGTGLSDDEAMKDLTVSDTLMTVAVDEEFKDYYGELVVPPSFDFNQDLSAKSLSDLRLLRNEIYARKGYLFNDAVLRGYFNGKNWYQPPWWIENFKVTITQQEADFIAKVKALESDKMKQNFLLKEGQEFANMDNIVNTVQFKELPAGLMTKLLQKGFAIVPNKAEQLFYTYEENDYNLVPNFVTTDLYLQLLHMYFAFTLRKIEEEKFIPIMTELTEGLYKESVSLSQSADPALQKAAAFNATFYAIGLKLLSGKSVAVPAGYENYYKKEVASAMSASGFSSDFLEDPYFNYALFKPRGNYTRTEELKRYFRGMIWLQTAPLCLKNKQQVKYITLTSALLNSKKSLSGNSLLSLYKSVYEPTAFIIGEADNLSALDIVDFINKKKLDQNLSGLLSDQTISSIVVYLQDLDKNKIKPKIQRSCADKINLMPQRYLPDNEVLQALVDSSESLKREFPKGLDVFAAYGDKNAEKILMEVYKEDKNWDEYKPLLSGLQKKFKNFNAWDKSSYNKWIQSLLALQKVDKNYPYFMKTDDWAKKNLNAGLGSWAELKHDAILYAEQPNGAECGGGGPGPPVTVGYVEPNIHFWTKAIEFLDLMEKNLTIHHVMTTGIGSNTKQLREMAQFLLDVSKKELNKETLTENEYNTIKVIGSSAEYLTLSIMEAKQNMFSLVSGPDKQACVVSDVFTSKKDNVLEAGVGYANDIYVVVEIGGLLYLSKGAVFSYYEFPQPGSNRLTDEEWQERLEKGNIPPIQEWMKDLIVPVKPLETKPESSFSSGC